MDNENHSYYSACKDNSGTPFKKFTSKDKNKAVSVNQGEHCNPVQSLVNKTMEVHVL